MYVGRLETGKDHRKPAGERSCHRPAAPTIPHGSSAVVLIPTAVGCCPSAARRTEARPSGHRSLRSPLCSAARPVAVGSIPDVVLEHQFDSLSRWELGATRTWAGRSRRRCSVRGAARRRLATIQEAATNVEPYIRADRTRIWSLKQLERQLRPGGVRPASGNALLGRQVPSARVGQRGGSPGSHRGRVGARSMARSSPSAAEPQQRPDDGALVADQGGDSDAERPDRSPSSLTTNAYARGTPPAVTESIRSNISAARYISRIERYMAWLVAGTYDSGSGRSHWTNSRQ